MDYPKNNIIGVILAGGRGSRMDESDKGLITLHGETLIARVLRALEGQVGRVLISANRNLEQYRRFGVEVISDELPDYQGPLAGILTALNTIRTTGNKDIRTEPLLLTVPCDSPYISPGIGRRLYESLVCHNARLAVAYDGRRLHPVFSLMRADVRDSLLAFLTGGERKIDRWYKGLPVCRADCSDIPECFINLNTPGELEKARLQNRTHRTL